ncbi:MAG TPA: glycosyltransferase family 87 protein [Xanthobacteraceae bacterium]|jgi:hypothetical protein|nr:glycosyltransferase family 87 protein [Xanthobacteraceae bacterium]
MSLAAPHIDRATLAPAPGQDSAQDTYAKLTVAAAIFFITLEIAYLAVAGVPTTLAPWVDATNFVLGRDFLNMWMGARAVLHGDPAAWFDLNAYNAALRDMLGQQYPEHFWSYPPHLLLFIWPLGLLPYLPAYLVWCVVGIALYLFACAGADFGKLGGNSGAMTRGRLLFLAAAPGVAVCIFFGQNGFYTAALLVGGLLCRERRPILAGVLFGILTIKPQLGLLLPVMLLLERRWLTIATAVITATLLIAITALVFGANIWIEFWDKVIPQQQWLTAHGDGLLFAMVPSVFYGGRMLHLPASVDWTLQGIVSALAFAATIWTFWKRRDPALSLSFLITATFLFTPYSLNYDMVVFGFVVALLRERPDNSKQDHWLLIVVWTLPVTMMIAAAGHVPLAPIVLIAFACRLLWRLRYGSVTAVTLLAEQAIA